MFKVVTMMASMLLLVTAAMAIDCYDKNSDYKSSRQSNKTFLIAMLVCAIVCFLASIGGIAITKTP